VASKYKVLKEDETKGFWIYETEVINLIKICKLRNKPLYKRLVEMYEHLEDKKFNEGLINNGRN
jgi:hypothetical protein